MAPKLKVVERSTSDAPRKLGLHGSKLWASVQSEYAIADAGGLEMLAQACAALDRAESCREQIDADGEITRTKAGLREHALLKIELANRSFVVRTLARLGLDVEPVKAVGRPSRGMGI